MISFEDTENSIELPAQNSSLIPFKKLDEIVIIDDGGREFTVISDGQEYKAVNRMSQTVHQCLIMKPDEYNMFLLFVVRISLLKEEDFNIIKKMLIPDGVYSIAGDGKWYVIFPDHQGGLDSLYQSTNSIVSTEASRNVFSERQIKPIFKQIVRLVECCHKIGIYFRDFRLRKFVFVDKERKFIRVINPLELYLADNIGSDFIRPCDVCPAYTSPEILENIAYGYRAMPADIWGLGVMLFILLTGRYPFYEATSRSDLFQRIKARKFSFPITKNVSSSARWLIYGLLHPIASERPTATFVGRAHWMLADAVQLTDGTVTEDPQMIHVVPR